MTVSMRPLTSLGADISAPNVLVGTIGGARWSNSAALTAEVVGAAAAGFSVAALFGSHRATVLVVVAVWLVLNYHSGHAAVSPLRSHLRQLCTSSAYVLALVAVAAGLGLVQHGAVSGAVSSITAALAVAILCRTMRDKLRGPIRTVVVGDRLGVAALRGHWAGSKHVRPVGAVIVEPDMSPGECPEEILGVPTHDSLDKTAALVRELKAESVIVSPGPGFTSEEFRQLSWNLERSGAALGVNGVLDTVGSHRITPGVLGGATVMDVRSSRPSWLNRTAKAALDRVAGALLLVLVAGPVLMLMAIIRFDSKGPAMFRQTRVGRDGKCFTVYKLRTMHTDAEQVKKSMANANESDGILFKIKQDPRITRAGTFLRKSSLDELPQLINVVKGEMSLVGPRPALPSEVARYDNVVGRRLAVKPGITGLWQVSGRSDLSWAETVALDLRYTDNWRLTDDFAIAAKTVGAVVRAKGAY
jgi:exopolysaccharide biosynthesis polyprenyl glycosylphosphotransferase